MSVIQSHTGRGADAGQLVIVCHGHPASAESYQAIFLKLFEMPGNDFARSAKFYREFLVSNFLLAFTIEF